MNDIENPQAFPCGNRFDGRDSMTLRDFAAITALPAVIVQCAEDYRDTSETIEQMFARKSYALADAMLAQRTKGDAA
jgi:hypothetical protein